MRLQKILACSDCSERSAAAIEAALSLAKLTGASVDVLYVGPRASDYEPLDQWIFGKQAEPHQLDERASALAAQQLERFVASLPEATRGAIGTRLERGIPYEEIVRVAEEDGYDLIVMSTHGRTGMKRVMLGSVAERVLRLATRPVLTLR